MDWRHIHHRNAGEFRHQIVCDALLKASKQCFVSFAPKRSTALGS